MTETTSGTGTAAVPPKRSRFRKLLRLAKYALALAIVGIFIGNILWRMSGSNRWEPEFERNGVKVYSLKAPGAYGKQYKAVARGKYTLNQLVAGLIENATPENCKQHIPGCLEVKVIQPWNVNTMTDTVLWKLEMPPPFLPRESLIRSHIRQDPKTRTVTVDVLAAPNSAPRNPGTIRLSHFQNRWTYRPVGGGEVEIEFVQDIDMGGMFPDFLLNLAGADETYKFIHDQLPGLLDRDDLRRARYDFITEAE